MYVEVQIRTEDMGQNFHMKTVHRVLWTLQIGQARQIVAQAKDGYELEDGRLLFVFNGVVDLDKRLTSLREAHTLKLRQHTTAKARVQRPRERREERVARLPTFPSDGLFFLGSYGMFASNPKSVASCAQDRPMIGEGRMVMTTV